MSSLALLELFLFFCFLSFISLFALHFYLISDESIGSGTEGMALRMRGGWCLFFFFFSIANVSNSYNS